MAEIFLIVAAVLLLFSPQLIARQRARGMSKTFWRWLAIFFVVLLAYILSRFIR